MCPLSMPSLGPGAAGWAKNWKIWRPGALTTDLAIPKKAVSFQQKINCFRVGVFRNLEKIFVFARAYWNYMLFCD
jgi:hypothetical protein